MTDDEIDEYEEHFETIMEFIVRANTNHLPPDRWYRSVDGLKAIAFSAQKLIEFTKIQAAVMEDMHNHLQSIGEASMAASADPCRG